MYSHRLRVISLVALLMLLALLVFFSDLPNKAIISIAIIMLFLMIFTYVFTTKGSSLLKVFLILTNFIVLPVFILIYLDILEAFSQIWQSIMVLIAVVIVGLFSIQIIISLDIVELKWD